MRTLVIFIDMLRTDFLNLYSANRSKTSLDFFFESFRGTTFTNVFTPCPDTDRSLASFWTGKPCYETQCNRRGRVNSKFLKSDTFLDQLKTKRVQIKLFSNHTTSIFPSSFQNHRYYLKKLDDTNKMNRNSLLFIHLMDIHFALDDLGHNIRGVYNAHLKLTNSLEYIFTKFDKAFFDKIIFFSDHGHLMFNEKKSQDTFTNFRRSKIFLHIASKNAYENNIDDSFLSIMDISHLILNLYDSKKTNRAQKYKLNLKSYYKQILIEDFFGLDTGINQIPNIWTLLSKNNSITIQASELSSKNKQLNYLISKRKLYIKYPHLESLFFEHMAYNDREDYISDNYFDGSRRFSSLRNPSTYIILIIDFIPPILYKALRKLVSKNQR